MSFADYMSFDVFLISLGVVFILSIAGLFWTLWSGPSDFTSSYYDDDDDDDDIRRKKNDETAMIAAMIVCTM